MRPAYQARLHAQCRPGGRWGFESWMSSAWRPGLDPRDRIRSGSRGRNKICEFVLLEMLIESPTLDLSHHFFELGFRNWFVNEPLATRELAEIPTRCLEFSRDR